HALAAAAFADDAERLAGRDVQADPVHRADERAPGARVEVGPQVLDGEQRRVHHFPRLPSRRLLSPSPSSWNPRMVARIACAGAMKLVCRRNAILPAIRLAITGMPVMPTTTMT